MARLAALGVSMAPATATAAGTLIVVPREAPARSDAETMQRVRGELAADGFEVVVIDRIDTDRVAALARLGRETGTTVCGGVFVDAARGIDLVLVDPATGRSATRHLEGGSGSPAPAPEVIARRAVDLLRVSLVDFLVESLRTAKRERTPQSVPPAEVHVQTAHAPETARHWAIEAGVGLLAGLGGVGPAVSPITRVRFAPAPPWQLRLTVGWLGSEPRVDGPGGSASIQQGVAVVEGALEMAHTRWLRPIVSAGAGVYYAGADGTGTATSHGEHASALALALDAGLGGAVPLLPRLDAVVEAHAIVATPGLAVRFVDTDVARIGRPSILLTLTIAGWI
ncbi:MAG: hypothetical protein FWD17_01560 [Polyangiaceae bacterium]|nr:hypothetical protein [Polyangiaceae bacterium]